MSCSATSSPVAPGPSCHQGMFPCDNNRCLPLAMLCDGHVDCFDEFDEHNCDSTHKVYQVLRFGVEDSTSNATSIKLYWWLPTPTSEQFDFQPAYRVANSPHDTWIVAKWITATEYLFTGLQPYTTYNLTVQVRHLNTKEVYPPGKFVLATTKEAQPEAPWNVTVRQLSVSQVQVNWLPPHQPNGPLTEYIVYMTPPIPPLCKKVHASKTQILIDSDFVEKNYSFWVHAKNSLYQSNSSAVVKLEIDPAARLEAVQDLQVSFPTSGSVTLSWRATTIPHSWRVQPHTIVSGGDMFFYPSLPFITTDTHTCTVSNLAPGTEYIFEVVPFRKNFEGRRASIHAKTLGEPLGQVLSVQSEVVKSEGTSIKVGWSPMSDSRKVTWQYGIYYGHTLTELLTRGPQQKTTSTSATVRNLAACQSYVVAVGLVGPLGLGPLSPSQSVVTQFNPAAPPKAVRVLSDPHNNTAMSVTWSASCPVLSQNISYEITVTEVNLGGSASFRVGPSAEPDLQHTLVIEHGGHYNVCVSTAVRGSASGPCQEYWARPLPPPAQLQLLQETNGSHVLYWHRPELPNQIKYHFVVLVSKGSTLDLSSAKEYKTESAPYIFTPPDEETIYSYAVLLESESGYRSMPSEFVSLASTKAGAWTSSQGASLLLPTLLVVAVVCCLLAAALGFVSFRHRRLQHTFSLFANSHFSTRSGTATFTGSDPLEDEDSPVIRGFSDDEPLVIA